MLGSDTSIVCPVLIGRAHYLQPFERLLEAAAGGRGSAIAISGEAGIGKSRLTRELKVLSAEALPDRLVLQGHCFERDATLPFAPMLDLLRSFVAPLDAATIRAHFGDEVCEIVKLLPELATVLPDATPSPALDHEQEKRRLFHALIQVFARIARAQPLLVVIEDLHWGDDTSLDFLSHFARRASELPIVVMLTYRADEVGPSLAHFLAGLDRERAAIEWRLEPFTRDHIAAMIMSIFDLQQPPRAEFLEPIHELTDGNPYFIEEVLKSLTSSGEIFYERGSWDRKPIAELNIPRSVQDAVRQRSAHISTEAQRLLVYAAVAGRRFDIALLAHVSGWDERNLLPLLKELVAAQLLVEETGDRFAFRHALTQQAVYSSLLVRERRGLHRQVAESLEASASAHDDARLAEMAHHFYEAAMWDRAFEYSSQIGDRAQKLYSPGAAIQHYTRALDAASRAATSPPAWVYAARGSAYQLLGDFDRAREDHESSLRMMRDASDFVGEWQALIDLGFLWSARDYDRSGEYFRRALDLARSGGDELLLARSLNRLGNWLVNVGRAAEGLDEHTAALEIFERANDAAGMGATHDLLGMANGMYGDLPAAIEHFGQAIATLREVGDDTRLMSALTSRAIYGGPNSSDAVPPAMRSFEEAQADVQAAIDLAQLTGSSAGLAYAYWTAGAALGGFGRFTEGIEMSRAGLRLATDIAHEQWIAGAQFQLGQIYWQMIDADAAIRELESARPLAESLKSAWWTGNVYAYLALAYLQRGDLDAARSVLDAGDSGGRAATTLVARRMRRSRAELLLAEGDPERALVICDDLARSMPGKHGGVVAPLLLTRARALMALDRVEPARGALEAARDSASTIGADPWLWRIDVDLARAREALGDSDAAAAAQFEAREVVERLARTIDDDGQRERFVASALPAAKPLTPRRAASIAFGGLTEREREVAAHVTAGRTNREIAAALVLSERTVETHVANIFSKLGFTSRAQIAAWGAEHGLQPDP